MAKKNRKKLIAKLDADLSTWREYCQITADNQEGLGQAGLEMCMNCNKCVYMPGHPELDPNNAEGMIAMDCVDCGGVSFCSKDCMEAATQSGVHAVQQCNEFQLLDQCYAVIDQIQAASASAPASASGSALGIEKEEEGAKDVIENKDDNEPGQWIQGKPIWLPGVFTPSLPPAPSSPAAAASNVPDASNNVDPSSQLISSITLGHKPEPVTLLPPSLSSSSSSFQASSEERSPITNAWDAYFHAVQRSPDWSNAERAIATHSLSLPATIAYAVSSAPALNKKIREGEIDCLRVHLLGAEGEMECVGAEKWLEVLRLLNQVGFVPDSGREAKETQKKGKPDSQEDNSDDDGDDTDNDNDSCNSVDTIANISNLQIVCVGPNVPEELADQIFTMSSSAFLTPTALSPSDSAVDKTDKNNSDDAKDNDDDDSNNDSVSMSRSDIEYGYSVQVSFIRAVYDDFYKREKKRYKNRKKKAMKRKAKELKENNNDNIGTSSSTENAFITGASSSDSVSSPTSLSIPSSLVPPSAEILSPIPHMIVAFNSGICDFRDSWRETATLIADDKIPCCFTSYHRREAMFDCRTLREAFSVNVTHPPTINPFASEMPIPDPMHPGYTYSVNQFLTLANTNDTIDDDKDEGATGKGKKRKNGGAGGRGGGRGRNNNTTGGRIITMSGDAVTGNASSGRHSNNQQKKNKKQRR